MKCISFKQIINFILNNGITSDADMAALGKIRLLNFSAVLCFIFLSPLAVRSFFLGNYFFAGLDLLVIILFVFGFFHIRFTCNHSLASHLMIHSLFTLLVVLVYKGGIGNTGVLWIFIFPMAAFFLYDLKRGAIFTMVFIAFVAFLLFAPVNLPGASVYPVLFRSRLFASFLAVSLCAALYEVVRERNYQKLKQISEKLDELAKHDTLTGLLNRRGIYERIEYEYNRAKRNNTPLSVIICDIDFFKNINDQFGHDAGDCALAALAELLKSNKRSQDLIARWGGEEFLLLLPDTQLSGCLIHAENIRKAVSDLKIDFKGNVMSLTMSLGSAEIEPHMCPFDAITLADKRLLKAKLNGKNQVLPVMGELSLID